MGGWAGGIGGNSDLRFVGNLRMRRRSKEVLYIAGEDRMVCFCSEGGGKPINKPESRSENK